MQLINETEAVKYRVIVGNEVLTESLSMALAERFVESLAPDMRSKVSIIPVTPQGTQLLFG